MKQVTVKKAELRDVVEENRSNHQAMFDEAVEGYRQRAVELLDEHINRIKKGKIEEVFVRLPKPEDHTHDYDRVLMMIEMEVDDQITLTASEFENYVMDYWPWKQEFLATTQFYTEG